MSISIGPMSLGSSLPQMPPQITPAATGNKAPSAGVQAQMPTLPEAVAAANAKEGDAVKLSAQQTQLALQEINKVLAALSIGVQFQIDPHYKEPIIKVVEQETGRVIRQIPSEDVVRMSKVVDTLKGLLFSQAV